MMSSTTRMTSVLALCVALAGCKDEDPPVTPDAGPISTDDAGTGDTCGDPGAPYGTSLGKSFKPLNLTDCEGAAWDFYGETGAYEQEFCEAGTRFTVLTMAAGWCGPCQVESQQLQEKLADAYEAQGVRVVQALIQDEGFNQPSVAFCREWRDRYGLEFPVLMDGSIQTQVYFPMGSLPATLIVDEHGTIVHREHGVSTGLSTIKAALDRLLAE